MSGGAGGVIIIKKLAEPFPGNPIPTEDRAELTEIADRNPGPCCGVSDALRVMTIVWKALRP